MRVRGVIGGAGGRVAVPVGVGGALGVYVAVGVGVDPMAIGIPLQAVNASARISPEIVWSQFMACLYW